MFINFINIFKEQILTLLISSFFLNFYFIYFGSSLFPSVFFNFLNWKVKALILCIFKFFSEKAIQDYHFSCKHRFKFSPQVWAYLILSNIHVEAFLIYCHCDFRLSLLVMVFIFPYHFWFSVIFLSLFCHLPREVANISHYDSGLFYFLF